MSNVIQIRTPTPHSAQRRVLAEAKRFNVLCCGRRWGKSKLGIYLAVRGVAARVPITWFSPTYKMLMDAWRELVERLRPITTSTNVQEKRIEMLGGATLDFFSLDTPDAARGRKSALALIDEAAMVDALMENWQKVVLPTLTDLSGSAWFMSTPRGYSDFYDLYLLGKEREEWASWQMPTSANPFMKPEELALMRLTMDPEFYAQEYEAEFTAKTGRVVHTFSRAGNVVDVEDHGGELLIGMDFNVDPMSATVAVRAADELHVFDEIELHNSGTEEMALEIRNRFGARAIAVYPDPSGRARKTSATVGQTDFTILRAAGFDLRAPSRAPLVVDRINELRALCCNVEGRRRLKISPRCRSLIKCLDQLSYKDSSSIIDKTQGYDHLVDALSYTVSAEFPISTKFEEREVFGL